MELGCLDRGETEAAQISADRELEPGLLSVLYGEREATSLFALGTMLAGCLTRSGISAAGFHPCPALPGRADEGCAGLRRSPRPEICRRVKETLRETILKRLKWYTP